MNTETLEKLREVSTATISIQLLKRGIRNTCMRGVHALDPDLPRMVGPAYTLRYIPLREDLRPLERIGEADNIARRAIEQCPAGSVLVSDAREETSCGTLGDILAARLRYRGAAGFVSDGAVRDAKAIRAVALPVYSSGSAPPASPAAHVPVDSQVPIACGGVAVLPGDIVIGDTDGVVVLPASLANEVADDGAEQEGIEAFIQKLVSEGRPIIGTYPPTDAIRAEYERQKAEG